MFKLRIICLYAILHIVYLATAQKDTNSWHLQAGYEVNYTGHNTILHVEYALNNHLLGGGINYNLSDGFASNPVLGIGLSCGYIVVQNKKWQSSISVDYRRQKPLKIVNIQTVVLAQSVKYQINNHLGALSRIGYGFAAERTASAGSFAQFNNVSGLFTVACVYSF